MGQISCSECGISFVVPDVWHEQRRNDGKTFYYAAGGVCPCCNRTFSELARHMKMKHPRFVAEPIAGDA